MSRPKSSTGSAAKKSDSPSKSTFVANQERAKQWLQQVLMAMGIAAEVRVVGEVLEIEAASLTSDQKQLLLSKVSASPLPSSREAGLEEERSPVVLDALQYLANTLLNLNLPEDQQQPYILDLDGYRQRRLQELKALVAAAVEKVRAGGREYEFPDLSAAERRQIHTLLKDPAYADLETFSRGKEPDRRLVIRLASSS
ncbi:protein jag [Synechococcus sp. H55.10]|uniref:Jag family protein n=1 Tax=Synechococcus sp. H55.10 TaxID=2964503 RepID=UPI0039C62C32